MDVMAKLRGLFERPGVPEEARSVFQAAHNPSELREGLEALRAKNEIKLQKHENELLALDKGMLQMEDQIRKREAGPTGETVLLRRVQRMEKERDNLEGLVGIYNGNTNLLLNLIARLQEMDAKRALGVGETEIDAFLDDVKESVQDYRKTVMAGAGAETVARSHRSADDEDLERLRRRILGGSEEGSSERPPRRLEASE